MKLKDCKILDAKVLYAQGSFSRVIYWVRGWVVPSIGTPRFIHGLTGRETAITVNYIKPVIIFEVEEGQ